MPAGTLTVAPMRLLFAADIHYALKQFDWLVARAGEYDAVAIGGDLLDLSSPLDFDVQIVVVEKYLARLRERTRVLVPPVRRRSGCGSTMHRPISFA